MICEWNLLFWRLDLAYFREKKDLRFDDLVGPVKKMVIPKHGPQNKLTKLYNFGLISRQNGLPSIIVTTKLAHLRSN